MLRMIAINKLEREGFTRPEAEFALSHITVIAKLESIYSIRVDQKLHKIKIERTDLSPEELYKEAFINFVSTYMKEHKDDYTKDRDKAVKLLKAKLDLIQIASLRQSLSEE